MTYRDPEASRSGDDSSEQLARVARGGALNLVGAVVSAASGFGLVVVVARYFTPTVAGTLFTATSLFMILSAVTVLGTDVGLSRFMLRFEALGRSADIPALLRVAFRPVLVASVALTTVLIAGADVLAPRVGLEGGDGPGVLRIIAAALPFAAVAVFSLAGTQAFGRMRPTVLVDNVLRPALQVVAAMVVGWLGAGVLALTWAWVLPYVAAAVVSTLLATRLLEQRSQRWGTDAGSSRAELRREFWSFTWARGVARIFQIAIQRVDIILIAVLIDPAAAAVYTAATRFVVFGQFSVQAIQRVLKPRFSQLLASGDNAVVSDVFKVSTSWSMALSWPLYLGTAAAAPLYLQLFGSTYGEDGRSTVVIMSVAMMVAVAAGPLDTLLLMSGRSIASLANTAVALAVDVALCVVLIPSMGISGAAVAWGAAVVTKNLLAFVQIRSDLGITPFDRSAAIVALASIGWIAVPLLLVTATIGLGPLELLVVAPLGIAGYLGTLWFSRRSLELGALRAVLRRRSDAERDPTSTRS